MLGTSMSDLKLETTLNVAKPCRTIVQLNVAVEKGLENADSLASGGRLHGVKNQYLRGCIFGE